MSRLLLWATVWLNLWHLWWFQGSKIALYISHQLMFISTVGGFWTVWLVRARRSCKSRILQSLYWFCRKDVCICRRVFLDLIVPPKLLQSPDFQWSNGNHFVQLNTWVNVYLGTVYKANSSNEKCKKIYVVLQYSYSTMWQTVWGKHNITLHHITHFVSPMHHNTWDVICRNAVSVQ